MGRSPETKEQLGGVMVPRASDLNHAIVSCLSQLAVHARGRESGDPARQR